jgi:formate hydrogenlyase transcriptional activator
MARQCPRIGDFIERAVILSRGPDLEVPLGELARRKKCLGTLSTDNSTTLEGAKRDHILSALKVSNWVIGGPAGAAARLGMKRTTLHSLVKRLGISRPG